MTLVFLVFFSFLPLILWVFLTVKYRIASLVQGFVMTVSALAAVVCASVFQVLLDPALSSFSGLSSVLFSSFVEAALVEELSKLAFINLATGVREPVRPPSARGILACALTLGLSFSAFETLSYALRSPSAIWVRALTALPVHASASLAAGALVARLRGLDVRASLAGRMVLFTFAILLHGAYDAGLSLSGPLLVASFCSVGLLVLIAVRLWKESDPA